MRGGVERCWGDPPMTRLWRRIRQGGLGSVRIRLLVVALLPMLVLLP